MSKNFVEALLVANPYRSDRAIAAELGLSAGMVGRARKVLESWQKIPVVTKRIGLDGKARMKRGTRKTREARGRKVSSSTVLIRALLEDTAGQITFRVADSLLKTAGFQVSQNVFNVTKARWKQRQIPPK